MKLILLLNYSIMADFRCEPCGNMSFKTNQAYQRHVQTNKHKRRQTCREDLLQCLKCNKWYCGKSGLFHHKKACASSRLTQVPIPAPLDKIEDIMERKMDEMKQGFENAMKEQINKILEKHVSMQQEIDEQKKELKQTKDIIAVLLHNANKSTTQCSAQPQHKTSRDKRKKISKDMRQQVVDKQENSCGECKIALTPYFQIDHIIALQFGGTDDGSNLMALCCECHAKKSIAENKYRKQIQDAIQKILREKLSIDQSARVFSS
jgi:5-methylcytosine-specific restriction endonuclease McrA